MSRQETFGSSLVRRYHLAIEIGSGRGVTSLVEQEIDDLAVDTLEGELLAHGPFSPWTHPVTRLDPGMRERRVVEDPESEQAFDHTLHEVGSIAGTTQAPADLGDGTCARFEEARGVLEDDHRVIDLRSALAPLGECRARAVGTAGSASAVVIADPVGHN